MNPDKITLDNLNKNFEYERISREIDSCDDIDQLKNIAKSYVKLHLKYQETLTSLNFGNL
jgi:hypothetical protein